MLTADDGDDDLIERVAELIGQAIATLVAMSVLGAIVFTTMGCWFAVGMKLRWLLT
jgi:hypothetical protein